jgi:hypothetical protein
LKRALLLVVLLALPAQAVPDPVTVETAHYRIRAEAARPDVEEMGRVLEAAWPQWVRFFGAEPEPGEGEKLEVCFGATQESFFARLKADGITPPQAGGYYSPQTRVAYLFRQPTIYNTRCLLLHETTHQFHYLARTGNRSVPATWYVEGLAEYLGRHSWDGEHLVLGQLPLLSLCDYSGKALAEDGITLQQVVAGEGGDRPLWFALVRFLLTAQDGQYATSFARLAEKLDRGGVAPKLFGQTVGSPRQLEKPFRAWLATEQEPWRQIYNEWEGIGPGRFAGTAGGSTVSTCAVKAPVTKLGATLETPSASSWIAGILLHHVDGDDYTTALCYGGKVIKVARRQAGGWLRLGEFPCPEAAEPSLIRFEAERRGGKVALIVEGRELGEFELPGRTMGLALQGSTVRYRNVTWE